MVFESRTDHFLAIEKLLNLQEPRFLKEGKKEEEKEEIEREGKWRGRRSVRTKGNKRKKDIREQVGGQDPWSLMGSRDSC